MFWYEWSENHNFSPIQSHTKSSPLSKYYSSSLVCARETLISLRKRLRSLCRISCTDCRYMESQSHNTRNIFCIFTATCRWWINNTTRKYFISKSPKKYYISSLCLFLFFVYIGKNDIFEHEKKKVATTLESWSVIVGSIYNNETY